MRFVNENHMCSTAKLAYVHLHLRYNVFAKPQFLSMHGHWTLDTGAIYRCIVHVSAIAMTNNATNNNSNGVIEIYTELCWMPA